MLQPVALAQKAYFEDSFSLKDRWHSVVLNSDKRYSIFSFDAVSMYTNIDTNDCIEHLSKFLLQDKKQKHFS